MCGHISMQPLELGDDWNGIPIEVIVGANTGNNAIIAHISPGRSYEGKGAVGIALI